MNIKNNKRYKEAAESIKKAFLSLLQDKELREVTVTDICELADIEHSTFYASFIVIVDLF